MGGESPRLEHRVFGELSVQHIMRITHTQRCMFTRSNKVAFTRGISHALRESYHTAEARSHRLTTLNF